MQGSFFKYTGRVVTALAISAIFASASFAAGPMSHKARIAQPKATHMIKTSKKVEAVTISEEDMLKAALQNKNISADGKTLTDKRDGKKYSVEIRGDKAWMKSNLAFSISTPRQCLMENEDYCKQYGRFYSHNEAKMACPAGWHLPNDGEWRDYQKDQSKLDWNNLGKGGCKNWDGYCESSSTGHYWSESSVQKNTGRSWEFRSVAHSINRTDESASKGLYVRCVADLR